MRIKIITDSVSDIPNEIIGELNIEVLPLSVNFEDASYYDRVELTNIEFFNKLKNSKKIPTTSQVNPGEFKKAFEIFLESFDQIICITMSKEMSGTFKAANIAKKLLNTDRIRVFDSKAISFGFGLIVINAARDVKANKDYDEIIDNINYNIENLENIFIIDTLEFLQKGGRLSVTEAFVGSVLKMKPILTIRNGKLEVMSKVRGRKKAINYVVKYLKDKEFDFSKKTIGLFDAVDKEYLNDLIFEIEKEFIIKEIIKSKVGFVVGAHAGPGGIAITFIK